MATPITTHSTISHDELRRKYTEDGWEDRLKNCKVAVESTPGYGHTIQKTLSRYRDQDGSVIAVTCRYHRKDGERFVVRMLREGDTVYSGPAVAGTPPAQ